MDVWECVDLHGAHLCLWVSISILGGCACTPTCVPIEKGGLSMLLLPSVSASESLSVSGVAKECHTPPTLRESTGKMH